MTARRRLGDHTTVSLRAALDGGRPVVALVPVGSVEPHGPHLSLLTDVVISEGACERAAARLEDRGLAAVIAPAVPYGVTECAAGFAGAVSVPAEALTAYLAAVARGLLAAGCAHVCLVNNHLEPAHDQAVRAAAAAVGAGVSVACPLTRRWARTLSPEFKSGACHAGRYETSIVLAQAPDAVDDAARAALPEVPISLSEQLGKGVGTFAAMGMDRAYAGAPAAATAAEGEDLLARLAEMVVGEVVDAMAGA
ncbi:MAG: creatininase family protein [Kofleriaceae bacterium]|nr:creatininase family protein [Myxococcales bacterium]MCB9564846.1 creatininase family protein [Kofleriaceae bacterium]MCB9574152.1 creatininase family protein [Kofleriaceae bacterium]